LQAGGHRFDPGWLHSRRGCKPAVFACAASSARVDGYAEIAAAAHCCPIRPLIEVTSAEVVASTKTASSRPDILRADDDPEREAAYLRCAGAAHPAVRHRGEGRSSLAKGADAREQHVRTATERSAGHADDTRDFRGIEYLWGWWTAGSRYERVWAHDEEDEKLAFERFVDRVFVLRRLHPRSWRTSCRTASSLENG
jgi:hypothetical protein